MSFLSDGQARGFHNLPTTYYATSTILSTLCEGKDHQSIPG